VLISLLLLTSTASAQDAAVLPFMAWGVDADAAANLSEQLAQEIDFMAEYDSVFALDVPPPGMSAACLADPGCMAGVAATVETQLVIAGQVSGTAEQFDVFAVLYDAAAGQFIRQHRFQIAPSAIADEIAGQARFLVTGQAPAAGGAASSDDFSFDEEDDFEFGEDETIDIPASSLDLSDVIDNEPVRERTRERDPMEREPVERERVDYDRYDDRYDDPAPITGPDPRDDMDKPRIDSGAAFTARVGYARYQNLNMVTWGGELSIDALKPFRINLGLEAQSLPLPIPGTENDFGVPEVEWRSVMPLNIGGAFVFYTDTLTPYVGLDLTLTAYTSDFSTAPGVRARAGFDYMVNDVFGVNANAALGGWFGTNTDGTDIVIPLDTAGFSPQFSLGTVLAF